MTQLAGGGSEPEANALMIVEVLEGLPGAQKTRTAMTEMIEKPARYLMASPRIALMEEQAIFIRDKAKELGVATPLIVLIHSENGKPGDVHRQMKDAAKACTGVAHAIVFVTHETLRAADLTPFSGWHARIDEVPDGVASGSFQAGAAYQILEPIYKLDPVGESGWSQVTLRDQQRLHPQEIMHDTSARPLEAFHRYASSTQRAFVNVSDWTETRARSKRVIWWSLWTPLDLANFASVSIACANFESSLCYLTSKNWFGHRISFCSRRITTSATCGCGNVTIRYFTKKHTGSTAFWDTSDGRKTLNLLARYFMQTPAVGFWSANKVARDYLEHWIGGEMVLPKLAGTNSLIDHTSCAIFYSSKPQLSDAFVYRLFDIDKESLKRARETEDLIQFVMRGAIRRPEFDGNYEIYVYELAQAEEIRTYLTKNTAHKVQLLPVAEAGLIDQIRIDIRSSRVEELRVRTDDERREADRKRKAKSRAKEKSEKIAAGTYASPGRPKTMTSTVQDGSP